MNNYSLIYKHRTHSSMWVLGSFTRPGKETLGAGNGTGSGTGGGCSRRAGAERCAAAGGTPPPTGAQLQTAAAAEPRRPPKKLLRKTPPATAGAQRHHAWPVLPSPPAAGGSPWVPTAPGSGNDRAKFALHITQAFKPSDRKPSGVEIRN